MGLLLKKGLCIPLKVMDIVKEGRILPIPDTCPQEVYTNLILNCWKIKPIERLTATEAKRTLESMVERAMDYCEIKSPSNDNIDFSVKSGSQLTKSKQITFSENAKPNEDPSCSVPKSESQTSKWHLQI